MPKSKQKIPSVYFFVVAVVVLFVLKIYRESSARLETMDKSLSEKSKLGLVEFTRKKCHSLSPARECKDLMNCLEQKENWQKKSISYFGKFALEEVL
jgi:hypothetical protein